MGTACDVCQQQTGEVDFNPNAQRSYIKDFNKQMPLKTVSQFKHSNELGIGDAPNPNNVSPTTLPPLSPLIKQLLNKQVTKKPFMSEDVSGTKYPPFQLKKQKKSYDGQWKNGIPHGRGKAYYDNGTYFQGYFKNGVADCEDGIIIYPDGTYYRGQIRNSKSNGQGVLIYRDYQMTYDGEWLNDKPHGMGKESYKDGSYYIGNFVNGQKSGNGSFKWPDGSEYKGQFIDGQMHGTGQHRASNGQLYKGAFLKNKKQGNGQLFSQIGTYNGGFSNDLKNGYGQFIFSDGRIFRGNFTDGYPDGQGTMKLSNGQVITGSWRNGQIYSVYQNSKVINDLESRQSYKNLPSQQSNQFS